MRFLLALTLVFAAGCVTPAQIERLKLAQTSYRSLTDMSLQQFRDGMITEAELDTKLSIGQLAYDRKVQTISDEVVQQTEDMIEASESAISGVTSGGISAAVTTIGGLALHLYRNRTRKKLIQKV